MEKLIESINAEVAAFQKDAAAQIEKGNKSAGVRARKSALAIAKLMADFRKQSVAFSKEN